MRLTIGTIAFVFLFLFQALSGTAQTCIPACPTSDDVLIQNLIDSAAASGGGTVQLDARVYYTCKALVLKSNVHLKGAGRGATILRSATSVLGVTVENSYLGSTIGAVGANNISVSDLTIDHAACAADANGVSFIPAGLSSGNTQAYDGAVTTNGEVSGVEVLGTPDLHEYMIWNLRGQHIKILKNWVDGGSSSTSNQEGIESFGGYDVLIDGNTVKNIGGSCINLGAGLLGDTETKGLFATNNYLTGCHVGVTLGTADDGAGPSNTHTHIAGNVIRYVRRAGVEVIVDNNTGEFNLDVSTNSIRFATGPSAAGIILRTRTTTAVSASEIVANTIAENQIQEIRGSNAHGIRIVGYPNVRVLSNTISGTDNSGIFAMNTNDTEIVGNRVEHTGYAPIGVFRGTGETSRTNVERNRIRWSSLNAGVLLLGVTTATVRDNVFIFDGLEAPPSPAVYGDGACGITTSGSVVWYPIAYSDESLAPCP